MLSQPQRVVLAAVVAVSLALGYIAGVPAAPAKAADEVKSTATFEVYKDRAGEFRWRLKSTNGQNIAASGEGYADKRGCLAGIDSVKRNAPTARIEEKEQ